MVRITSHAVRTTDRLWSVGSRLLRWLRRLSIPEQLLELGISLSQKITPPVLEIRTVELPLGLKMVIPAGFPQSRTYAAGLYERELTDLFIRLVKRGMVVTDVGAFCGHYTLLASRLVGPAGKVYAFEPHPYAFEFLMRNIATNKCNNVIPVRAAVYNKEGVGRLKDLLFFSYLTAELTGSIEVRTMTLDAFFLAQGRPTPNIIKIDVEGGELFVLLGAKRVVHLSQDLDVIMEFNPASLKRAGFSRSVLCRVLSSLGFKSGMIVETGRTISIEEDLPKLRNYCNLLIRKSG